MIGRKIIVEELKKIESDLFGKKKLKTKTYISEVDNTKRAVTGF